MDAIGPAVAIYVVVESGDVVSPLVDPLPVPVADPVPVLAAEVELSELVAGEVGLWSGDGGGADGGGGCATNKLRTGLAEIGFGLTVSKPVLTRLRPYPSPRLSDPA